MSSAFFRTLAREAAAGYPRRDRFAHHFAYGKLAGDPVFEHLLRERLIAPGARVLDLGCGQGLLAALLLAARARERRGEWSAELPPPPEPACFTGIDLMARDVERAREMVRHWAPGRSLHAQAPGVTSANPAAPGVTNVEFIAGDIRTTAFPGADVAVILDVLHYIDFDAQAETLARVRDALAPRGTLLLRVGDASGSLRFRYTDFIDRLALRVRGHPLPRLWWRPAADWRAALERLGFSVRATPMSEGTSFANVLLVSSYDGSR